MDASRTELLQKCSVLDDFQQRKKALQERNAKDERQGARIFSKQASRHSLATQTVLRSAVALPKQQLVVPALSICASFVPPIVSRLVITM